MLVNSFAEFDFGVTALAQQFHQDWPSGGAPLDVADAYVKQLPHSQLAVLAGDLSFMIDLDRQGDYAGTLWFASTEGYYRPHLAGMLYEDFFRQVLHKCIEKLEQAGVSFTSVSMSRYRGRSSDVLREIQHLHSGLEDCLTRSSLWSPGDNSPTVIDALYRYAAPAAQPELAFRFLLRLIVASSCAISSTEYAHLREVGAYFEYGEFLMSAVQFLVEDDVLPE
jgi:hypothetical protein